MLWIMAGTASQSVDAFTSWSSCLELIGRVDTWSRHMRSFHGEVRWAELFRGINAILMLFQSHRNLEAGYNQSWQNPGSNHTPLALKVKSINTTPPLHSSHFPFRNIQYCSMTVYISARPAEGLVGCFEDLPRLSDLSAISRLGSRR